MPDRCARQVSDTRWRAASGVSLAALMVLALAPWACHRPRRPPATAVDVEPGVSLSREATLEGDAVAVSYRWRTGPAFEPLGKDYFVLVHALDREQAMVFTDDHAPIPPTTKWEPSREYSYTRVLFMPNYVSTPLVLRVGLYTAGERLALRGKDAGGLEYAVGGLRVGARRKPQVWFGSEWSRPASGTGDLFRPMRWLERATGRMTIENPRAEAVLLLRAKAVAALVGTWPALRVDIGPASWTLPIQAHEFELFSLRVPKAAWGTTDWPLVEMSLLRELHDPTSLVEDEARCLVLNGVAVEPVAAAAAALLDGAIAPGAGPAQ